MGSDSLCNALHGLLPYSSTVTVLEDSHKGPQGLVLVSEACQLCSLGPHQQLGNELT